jgi:hypothetical protein
MVPILMTFIRTRSVKSLSQVFRRMLLLVAPSVLSGTLIMPADAQLHNVDGTFLVDARVDGYRRQVFEVSSYRGHFKKRNAAYAKANSVHLSLS